VQYSLVAVDFMSEAALHAALSRVSSSAAAGDIKPLPHITHGMNAVTAAMRQMSQARHVGKVVVRQPASGKEPKPSGNVVITGDCVGGCSGI
jgi:hypothetical protein